MNQEETEEKFLDFFEGRLSVEEMDQIYLELASDAELQKSLKVYELVLDGERLMANEKYTPSLGFVDVFIDKLEAHSQSKWDDFLYWISAQCNQIVTACAAFLVLLYGSEAFWAPTHQRVYASNQVDKLYESKEYPTTEILVPVRFSVGNSEKAKDRFQIPLKEAEIAPYIAAKVPKGFRALTITARMSAPSKTWLRSKVRFNVGVNSTVGERSLDKIIARDVDVLFAERPIMRSFDGKSNSNSQEVIATLLLRASDVPMVELARSVGELELTYDERLPILGIF